MEFDEESRKVLKSLMTHREPVGGNLLQAETKLNEQQLVDAVKPLVQRHLLTVSGSPEDISYSYFSIRPSAVAYAERVLRETFA